jgi:hypothetical protein
MKPSYLAVVLSLVTKYGLLYLWLIGKHHDYYFLAPGIRNGEDLIYYLWLLLALPAFEVLCFSAPLYWTLTAPNRGVAAGVTLGSVALGAVSYHYVASALDPSNGVVLGLIGCVLQELLLLKTRRPRVV